MRQPKDGDHRDSIPRGLEFLIFWHCSTAGLALAGIAGAFWYVSPKLNLLYGLEYGLGLMIFIMVIWWLLLKIVLSTAGTIGIIKAREWGRQTSIVHAALTLLFVPIGIVVGAIVILYLHKPRIKEYFNRR